MKNKKLSDYSIVNEFNQTKNKGVFPQNIFSQSPKKYWWICSKGHEWEASCNLRIGKGRSCPYCSNQKVCKDNCLATLYPNVAKEWHPFKNEITPYDIVAGTTKRCWWICSKGHEWEVSCVKRISGKECPFCKGRKVCKDNCLATLYPNVAKEWHPLKNGIITPNDIIAGTATKYWWVCSKGHDWRTSCVKRTRENRGCPICKESHGERAIRNYLENNNILFESQCKFETCKRILPLAFDFVIWNNGKIYCIEYQGEQHYKQVVHFKDKKDLIFERDEIKRNWCKNENVILLEIPYWDYKNIKNILDETLV